MNWITYIRNKEKIEQQLKHDQKMIEYFQQREALRKANDQFFIMMCLIMIIMILYKLFVR